MRKAQHKNFDGWRLDTTLHIYRRLKPRYIPSGTLIRVGNLHPHKQASEQAQQNQPRFACKPQHEVVSPITRGGRSPREPRRAAS